MGISSEERLTLAQRCLDELTARSPIFLTLPTLLGSTSTDDGRVLSIKSSPWPLGEGVSGVLADAEAVDQDGGRVSAILFAGNGRILDLEVYRGDGAELIANLTATDFKIYPGALALGLMQEATLGTPMHDSR